MEDYVNCKFPDKSKDKKEEGLTFAIDDLFYKFKMIAIYKLMYVQHMEK